MSLDDLLQRPEWHARAACRNRGTELWFPTRGESTAPARAICAHCPVADLCLADAMSVNNRHGIWGGKSERERRALRRERAEAVRKPILVRGAGVDDDPAAPREVSPGDLTAAVSACSDCARPLGKPHKPGCPRDPKDTYEGRGGVALCASCATPRVGRPHRTEVDGRCSSCRGAA